jgi:hypothetical protein
LLLGRISTENDVFGRPAYAAYTSVETLMIAVEDWELRDKAAATDFLCGRYSILNPLEYMAREGYNDFEMTQYILEKRATGDHHG